MKNVFVHFGIMMVDVFSMFSQVPRDTMVARAIFVVYIYEKMDETVLWPRSIERDRPINQNFEKPEKRSGKRVKINET